MGRPFTADEDAFFRENYLTTPAKRMAKMLGRSEGTGRQRMKILGLIVPTEIIEKFKKDSYIKKGDVSFNKGKKQSEYMTPEAIVACKKTCFKKGNLPYNTKETNGVISIRRDTKTQIDYQYIRVAVGEWELLQRYNYRMFIGDIPNGHVVILKDGNCLNCHPFNLELISQRENMLRNSIQRYPGELIKTMKILSRLKKQIKTYGTK
jgi:hypothetical protein